MNPRYALSYALAPNASLKMDCKRESISPADVITALGWASKQDVGGMATNMIRVKWARDESAIPALHRAIVKFSDHHFALKRWNNPVDKQDVFAMQVLAEYDDSVCHSCRGRGVMPNPRGVQIPCQICKGIKREIVSGRARARALQMSETHMRDVWGARLDYIQGEIVEVERLILNRIKGYIS